MRVLIAPDKFKGTLTAEEAAAAIAQGWGRARPKDEIELLPISDGGDGFGTLLGKHLRAEAQTVETADAAGRPLVAQWWWEPRQRLAIIESATVIGLAMLPKGRFHPFELDTFGLGAVLRAAARKRPRRCLVGIGGSATNDAGFGLARALGWKFLDRDGGRVVSWTALDLADRIVPPRRLPPFRELIVAVDVRNRLLGAHGATRVYGPQKGIRPEDVAPAERCFRRLLNVGQASRLSSRKMPARACPNQREPKFRRETGETPVLRWAASQPGSGAAGGLGFGLVAFAGARIEPGFELFAKETGLEERLRHVDLVLTGEGALDLTSVAMGKGVGQLGRLCRTARAPCVGLAGVVADHPRVKRAFSETRALTPDLTSPASAQRQAARWLEHLAMKAGREWRQRSM